MHGPFLCITLRSPTTFNPNFNHISLHTGSSDKAQVKAGKKLCANSRTHSSPQALYTGRAAFRADCPHSYPQAELRVSKHPHSVGARLFGGLAADPSEKTDVGGP